MPRMTGSVPDAGSYPSGSDPARKGRVEIPLNRRVHLRNRTRGDLPSPCCEVSFMYDRIQEPESEAAWIARSLVLCLRSIICLAESATETDNRALVSIVRDLADQASIWSDLLYDDAPDEVTCTPPGDGSIEAAMLVARSTAGLAGRLRSSGDRLRPEVRRAVACCSADLDVHARWAAEILRTAEVNGFGERLRRAWSRLPSRQEFLGIHPVPRAHLASARAIPGVTPCRTSGEGASSAA